MNQPIAPFTCTHSPNLPELLFDLNCTLAISTYQAGKVVFISSKDRKNLVQLPRSFKNPMGIAFKDNNLAIATQNEVITLANHPAMAHTYPKKPGTYDGIFIPRAVYYTGDVDIHDLEWVNNELWAVNTRFSCIARISDQYSFESIWKPYFITSLAPEDRCHLNGMATEGGRLKFVSALGNTDQAEGWRTHRTTEGIIIDTENQEIIAKDLAMPHSPRVYENKLWVLLSATGELVEIDKNNGRVTTLKKLDGFVRGMCKYGDYLFIGLSKIRKESSAFGDLPIAKKAVACGIAVIYVPQMSVVGHLKYETSVEEIYDVKILPHFKRPGLLSHEGPEHRMALVTPDGTYWAKNNSTSHG
ncbi:TIGR03032 family protein [Fulvivirga sp. M361]|uniref:TIGR03032 family protein n=1 Tax=Fulvivirga sp. M361 TaxID=2594266 RepID=UPI00117B8521|nr:TIGR03032 family protein [Fulvivirga sp. M361]TRX60822.1 TIGR03032 family protein [Fulvivirga sp. M361]